MNVLALKAKPAHRIPLALPASGAARLLLKESGGTSRRKLWDLSTTLHCSIIGTCLTCGELRRIVVKIMGSAAEKLTDHEIHQEGVKLASKQGGQAKLLQKALDARHEAMVRRFAGAHSPIDLLRLWDEAKKEGDIPGGYWATITHPVTDVATLRRIFGDVHMLSHLVGSANRADIRRLAELEAQVSDLQDKIDRQQSRIRTISIERDEAAKALDTALMSRLKDHAPIAPSEENEKVQALAARLAAKVEREAIHRKRIEADLAQARADRETLRQVADRAVAGERDALAELNALEALVDLGPRHAMTGRDLSGLRLLYVGGRKHMVPSLQAHAESRGAQFVHHDGGQEDALSLLPGFISQSSVVVFPVDCISHNAVNIIKRTSAQLGKDYVPMPRSGLGSLLRALETLTPPAART